MTRLQKKCLAVSACFHGLTVLVLLATAAFRSEPVLREEQVLTLIPGIILDTPGVGGVPAPAPVTPATPRPATPPSPPATHPPPVPAPPPRTPTPPSPASRQSDPRPIAPTPAPAPPPGRHTITPTFVPVAPSARSSNIADSSAQARATALAAERAAANQRARELAEAFSELDSSIRGRAVPVTVATLPGEGGGDAFVNYRTAVFNAYYQAWKTPESAARRLAIVDVKIVVARNGDVLSSDIVSKSGDPAVDQSVQRALDQVEREKLPPFPPKAEDTQRTFIIRFNLEAKQSAG